MRLFFALWPQERVRRQLAHWRQELRAACGGRPIPDANLHLTLAFLGSVDDVRLAEVERAADSVSMRACTLALDQPGWWKRNRIAWAGASVIPVELEALVTGLRGALERAGIDFDAKGFVSHVTLLRDAHEPRALPVLSPIEWVVDGFALVQSITRERGSEYEVRKSWQA